MGRERVQPRGREGKRAREREREREREGERPEEGQRDGEKGGGKVESGASHGNQTRMRKSMMERVFRDS